MSNYIKTMTKLAAELTEKVGLVERLEDERNTWQKPEYKTFTVGGVNYYVVRQDGTVPELLAPIQAAAIDAIDKCLVAARSDLEGVRFKIAQLGKETRYD